MIAGTPLERRYRRLLAWYPPQHRATFGEEMIGVLLAAARDGQRRPGVADIADLLRGAVRAWMRAAVAGAPDRRWQEALSASSMLAAPLMIVLLLGQDLGWMSSLLWHSASQPSAMPALLWPLPVLLLPLALGVLGSRRLATAAALVLTVWVAVQAALGQRLQEPRVAGYLVLLGVQAVALAFSPGPRRGLELVSRRSIVVAIPWIATAAYAGAIVPTHYPVPLAVAELGVCVVAVAGLPALATPAGRRLVVLLVIIPGSTFLTPLLTFAGVRFYSMGFAASQFALYLPPVFLAGVTAMVVRRTDRGRPAEATAAS